MFKIQGNRGRNFSASGGSVRRVMRPTSLNFENFNNHNSASWKLPHLSTLSKSRLWIHWNQNRDIMVGGIQFFQSERICELSAHANSAPANPNRNQSPVGLRQMQSFPRDHSSVSTAQYLAECDGFRTSSRPRRISWGISAYPAVIMVLGAKVCTPYGRVIVPPPCRLRLLQSLLGRGMINIMLTSSLFYSHYSILLHLLVMADSVTTAPASLPSAAPTTSFWQSEPSELLLGHSMLISACIFSKSHLRGFFYHRRYAFWTQKIPFIRPSILYTRKHALWELRSTDLNSINNQTPRNDSQKRRTS